MEEATKTGQVNPNAGEIASRAFDFAGLSVAKVMVPRSRIVAIPRRASLDEVRALVLEKGHTRMPVFDGDLDNLTGYINVKDLIAVSWERPLFILEDIIRPAYFVVQTMRAVDLLEEMKRRRQQFAVVVDELGVTAGIITLEDLIEELVGEIASEHDAAEPPMTRAEPDGAFLVRGEAAVRDVNRELDSGAAGGGGLVDDRRPLPGARRPHPADGRGAPRPRRDDAGDRRRHRAAGAHGARAEAEESRGRGEARGRVAPAPDRSSWASSELLLHRRRARV